MSLDSNTVEDARRRVQFVADQNGPLDAWLWAIAAKQAYRANFRKASRGNQFREPWLRSALAFRKVSRGN